MPNNDYISNILEIKDLFITNINYTSKEKHIYFMLKRKDCVCPHRKATINKVHDYRTFIIKDSSIMEKILFFITENGGITVIYVTDILRNLFRFFLRTAASPHVYVLKQYTC